jgi:uncharacterized membrane protein
MNLLRLIRHLVSTRWSTRRHFTPEVRDAIERAVRDCEAHHTGEIRFAVETAFDIPELWHGLAPRQRALALFGQLGVWDTAHNNGVLIYVLMADRAVEIVADRGIAARIAQREWDEVCREMQRHYSAGRYREGSLAGITAVGTLLGRHFPGRPHGGGELPNEPVLL